MSSDPNIAHKPPCSFDSLPNELKLQILEYNMVTDEALVPSTHKKFAAHINLPSLLLVNKSLRSLIADMYYGRNTVFVGGMDYAGLERMPYPNPSFACWVRRLDFKLSYILTHTLNTMADFWGKRGGWARLFRPRAPLVKGLRQVAQEGKSVRPHASDWQQHFTSLKSLNITLHSEACFSGQIAIFHELPKWASIVLNPEVLTVAVKSCPFEDEECICPKVIKGAITSMIGGGIDDGGEDDDGASLVEGMSEAEQMELLGFALHVKEVDGGE